MRRARKRLIGLLFVADMSVVGDVAWRVGEDQRGSRPHRLFHIGDDGKVFPCHADQFGRVTRLLGRVGNHHRDDVANVVRFDRRHNWIGLERRARPVGVVDRSKARQVAKLGKIAGDIDGANAGRRARRFEIVDAEFRVPVGTA